MANVNAIFKKGVKRHEAGDLDAAARCYRDVVRAKPSHVDALYMLGTVMAEQGNLDEAEAHLAKAAGLNPKSHQIHNNLANVYRQQGKLDKALKHFQAMVRLAPAFLDGRVNYAMTLVAHGKATLDNTPIYQAMDELSGILAMHPDHWLSLLALGHIYKGVGNYVEAQSCYEKVLSLVPEHFEAHLSLAEIYAELGSFEEGTKRAEAALAIHPGDIRALTELARQFQLSGQPERASEILEQSIKDGQSYVPALDIYATCMIQTRESQDALQETAALLEDVNSSQPNSRLSFCLGDLYDSLEDYGKAFGCYQQANELTDFRPIDIDAHEKTIADLMGAYTASSIAKMTRSNSGGENLIFIVGMPRSGTTLAEQILVSHPDVAGAGECFCLDRVNYAHFGREHSFADGANLDIKVLDGMATGYLNNLSNDLRQAPKITDKTLGNYLEIGLIKQVFPDARILYTIRNPLDNCLSCYFHNFSGRDSNYTHDLGLLGRYYDLYCRLMKHWQTLFPDSIMELCYEELVGDPPRIVQEMLAFFGLEMNEDCLKFYNNPRYARTLSYNQVRQPIYKKAVDRYLPYERFLDPLKLALAEHDEKRGN